MHPSILFCTDYNRYITNKHTMQNFSEFLDYVYSFYNDNDGLYPISKLTKAEIALATLRYLDEINEKDDDNFTWGYGDTVDRERVRNHIVINRESVKSLNWSK